MNIKYAIKDFLYDQNFFIAIFSDYIFIYKYGEIERLSTKSIILKNSDFLLKIFGSNLTIKQMSNDELFIKGMIKSVEKIYQ